MIFLSCNIADIPFKVHRALRYVEERVNSNHVACTRMHRLVSCVCIPVHVCGGVTVDISVP